MTTDLVIEGDSTGESLCSGNLSDFSALFLSRFEQLEALIVKNHPNRAFMPLEDALCVQEGVIVSTIGMVSRVVERERGMDITIEDESKQLRLFFGDWSYLYEASKHILHDEVIGVSGILKHHEKYGTSMLPDDVIKPSLKHHAPNLSSSDISVAVFSDIHIGSNTFLADAFEEAIGLVNSNEKIKYALFAGDLIDGIGVYPDHHEDLLITDVMEQIQELNLYMRRFRGDITCILQPGNHDNVIRLSEPQPAFSRDLQSIFPPTCIFVSNPITTIIHGVRFLIYHGGSMNDLVQAIPAVTYTNPLPGMIHMLESRHLASQYGARTPLAPEHRDYLVIDEVPDVFITGHVHTYDTDTYKGVRLINAGSYQGVTEYQRMFNMVPTPPQLIVIDLKDLSLTTTPLQQEKT